MMTLLTRHETKGSLHASRGMLAQTEILDLICLLKNVTINPIEGDQEFMKEIQPHLNAGLWPVYLAQAASLEELRPVDPPTDGTEEAPGAHPKPPASILD